MSEEVAQASGVCQKEHPVFDITVGDGTKLLSQPVYPDVDLIIQGTMFSVDLYILAIGGVE